MQEGKYKYRYLLSLLRKGLGLTPEDGAEWMADEPIPSDLTAEEWNFIFDTAMVQGVAGIIYFAVQKLPEDCKVDKDVLYKLKWFAANTAKVYDTQLSIIAQQEENWREAGVEAILLKGVKSAQMYPYPEMRAVGDIDWWFPGKENWGKALEVLRKKGIVWHTDSDGDICYRYEGMITEHHRKGLAAEGPEGELFLRCEHILHHIVVTGVGLRHICDYIMALKFYEGKYDRESYDRLLEKHGLLKWERTLREMPDELLAMVLKDGNFGRRKKNRFGGFAKRLKFFMPVCPKYFWARWAGLAIGRLKRF